MDSSVLELWQIASSNRFSPTVGTGSQFFVGSLLVVIGLSLTGAFTLNRSLLNVPLIGLPASVCLAFGTVYMFCAVGVYV